MSSSTTSTREVKDGFTLIELLLVIGIIGIISAVVIVAINPSKQLCDAQNARRRSYEKVLRNALDQYLIQNYVQAGSGNIIEGSSNAKPICRKGITGESSCVNLDTLVPVFVVDLPVDPNETDANYTGYQVHLSSDRAVVSSTHYQNDCNSGSTVGSSTGGGGGGGGLIASGLVGHWKFDDLASNQTTDSSTNNNTGTQNGGVTQSGTISAAIPPNTDSFLFDGIIQYVDVGSDSSLDIATDASYMAWMRFENPKPGGYLIADFDVGGDMQIGFGHESGSPFMSQSYTMAPADFTLGVTTFSTGTWYHIAVIRDDTAKTANYYINGVEEFSVDYTGNTVVPLQGVMQIGARDVGSNETYEGLIDDVRIYNRAISEAELLQIATGGG